jgi:hypothetical protein
LSNSELKLQFTRDTCIQQGTWEERQVYSASSNNTTTRVWVDKEHIPTDQFWEAFAPDTYQEERRITRLKYSKETWSRSIQTLQELSLEAYSKLHISTIDSIELIFKIQIQDEIYHKVVIEDNRGLPIRYSTLEPYTVLELQNVINKAYQEWYKAGGYFCFKLYRNYPTFWINLWQIARKEQPIVLEWYLPKVEQGDTHHHQEEEEHYHQHSLDSYVQQPH